MQSNDHLSRRGFLKATGGVAAATALAGCDGDGDDTDTEDPGTDPGTDPETETATPTEEIDRGGTLNMINSSMSSLDPIAIGDTASGIVANQCYEGLMTYPNGEPVAEQNLATGYDTNDDYTEYTFTLEEGVEFQNDMGEMTAEDLVYSWERLAQSENSERTYFILDNLAIAAENQQGGTFEGTSQHAYAPGTMDLEATGDYEVSFTQRRAFHATLEMLAYGNFAVHPEGIVGDIEGYDGEVEYETLANSETYGTGPFQLEEWEPGDHAEVTAYDGFRRDGQPYLDGIHWQIIEDPEPQYRYSTNENADLLTIPTQYYDPGKVSVDREEGGREFGTYGPLDSGSSSGEDVNYLRVPEMATYYLAFDVTNTPHAVRQAVAYVINRAEISNSTFKQRLPPGYHLTPPSIYPEGAEAYDQHVQDAYPYGIEESLMSEAQDVMESAGYSEDEPYELTINSYPGIFTDMVRGLRDRLASAHFDVTVEPTQFATLIERSENGTLQCHTLGWIADWPAPDNFLQIIEPDATDVAEWGTQVVVPANWDQIESEHRDAATSAWDTIQNNLQPTDDAQAAREEAYVNLEEAMWDEAVLLPLVHGATERFYWDGVHVDPFGALGISRQTHATSWLEQ